MDGLVKGDHLLFLCRILDKPTIQRIIKDRFICPPAMRITMHALFYLEGRPLFLHLHTEDDVQVLSFLRSLDIPYPIDRINRVIRIFHPVPLMVPVSIHIHTFLHEMGIQILQFIIFPLKVNHRASLFLFVDQIDSRNAGIPGHLSIIRTESRSNMHDARTVIRCHIVTQDDTESSVRHLNKTVPSVFPDKDFFRMLCPIVIDKLRRIIPHFLTWPGPRHQLAVVHAFEVHPFHTADHPPGANLLRLIKRRQRIFPALHLLVSFQIGSDTILTHDERHRLPIIEIISLDSHIVDLRTYAKSHI